MSYGPGDTFMGLADFERRLFVLVLEWLTRFIEAAAEAVLAFAQRFGVQPNPIDVFMSVPIWSTGVDKIVDELAVIAEEAWDRTRDSSGVAGIPSGPASSDAFIMANLANSRNLLVRIPNEVYELVFAEITDGVN